MTRYSLNVGSTRLVAVADEAAGVVTLDVFNFEESQRARYLVGDLPAIAAILSGIADGSLEPSPEPEPDPDEKPRIDIGIPGDPTTGWEPPVQPEPEVGE